MPTMSVVTWMRMNSRSVGVRDLIRGRPPYPREEDSYQQKWLKLVWREMYESARDFKKEMDRMSPSEFARKATCEFKLEGWDPEEKAFKMLVRGSNARSDPPYALPEDLAQLSAIQSLICKLAKGDGWLHIVKVVDTNPLAAEGDSDESPSVEDVVKVLNKSYEFERLTSVRVFAERYRDDFKRIHPTNEDEADPKFMLSGKFTRIMPFDSFTSCRDRMEALQKYPDVCEHLRERIEARVPHTRGRKPRDLSALLVAPQVRRKSRLNKIQKQILNRLIAPIDFVQGPPGTGKSTFIVELLQTRIPPGHKVLVCTTTNKAIDSLVGKMVASGCKGILTFGNTAKMGPMSLSVTLDQQLIQHPTEIARMRLLRAAADAYLRTQQMRRLNKQREDKEKGAEQQTQDAQKGLDEEKGLAERAAYKQMGIDDSASLGASRKKGHSLSKKGRRILTPEQSEAMKALTKSTKKTADALNSFVNSGKHPPMVKYLLMGASHIS